MMKFRILTSLLMLAAPSVAWSSNIELRHFEDASLRAVQFLGGGIGWAAGDDGVILKTTDGGKTWKRIPSGTRASLRSISFISPKFGWIAGRKETFTGGSVGVLLFTVDGGASWQSGLSNTLPGMNRIRFVTSKVGFLMGDGTDNVPSGLFKTTDSGQSWQPVSGTRATTWYDGDFSDGTTGAVAGHGGRLFKLRLKYLSPSDIDDLGHRNVRGLRMMKDRALAVGDGGVVLSSKTKGAGWGFVDLKITPDAVKAIDWYAVDSIGTHVWIAGRAGSIILHSIDGGENWQVQKTNQSLPLYSIYFSDEKHGCAVGAHGTVLTTSDGGNTWRLQRQGGKRSAVMCIHANSRNFPLESLAHLGLAEGYLVTGLRVFAQDLEASTSRSPDVPRLLEAVRRSGGAVAESLWRFPLTSHLSSAAPREIVKHFDQTYNNDSAQEMLRQLVLAIRMWRPDVIITDDPEASHSNAGAVVADAVKNAVKLAADPKALPEQVADLYLKPWQVGKVYSLSQKKSPAKAVINADVINPRLLATASQYALPATSLLMRSPAMAEQRYFKLLDSAVAGAASQKDLMAGVEAKASHDARRKLPAETKIDPDVAKALQESRQLQQMAGKPAIGLIGPEQVIAQVQPVLKKLPPNQGATAAYAIANQYVRAGKWLLARETFMAMAKQYPTHPLTAKAYRWLIQHNTSSEAHRRYELSQYLMKSNSTIAPPKLPTLHQKNTPGKQQQPSKAPDFLPNQQSPGLLPDGLKNDKPIQYQGSKAVGDAQKAYLSNQHDLQLWYKSSFEFAKRLELFGPVYGDDPAVQFCVQSANRRLGKFKTALDWYKAYQTKHSSGARHEAAATEYWLAFRRGLPPKPFIECRPALSRPYLDGDLKDRCWQAAKPVALKNAVAESDKLNRTEVRTAFDDKFLYVAFHCTHPPEFHAPRVTKRNRDDDLQDYDRISLLIDLDRDYSTYYHFQVDQRGCVFEDCWGDKTWNPKWFVAAKSGKTSWTIEAAIPLRELTGNSPSPGAAWAVNVSRVLPKRGVQSVSLPAGVEPEPSGMGLLLFLPPEQRKIIKPSSNLGAPTP